MGISSHLAQVGAIIFFRQHWRHHGSISNTSALYPTWDGRSIPLYCGFLSLAHRTDWNLVEGHLHFRCLHPFNRAIALILKRRVHFGAR